MVIEDTVTAALRTALERRAPVPDASGGAVGCFLCGWILADVHRHGRPTGDSPTAGEPGKVLMPAESMYRHLDMEGIAYPIEWRYDA